jgi:hypothetical protein
MIAGVFGLLSSNPTNFGAQIPPTPVQIENHYHLINENQLALVPIFFPHVADNNAIPVSFGPPGSNHFPTKFDKSQFDEAHRMVIRLTHSLQRGEGCKDLEFSYSSQEAMFKCRIYDKKIDHQFYFGFFTILSQPKLYVQILRGQGNDLVFDETLQIIHEIEKLLVDPTFPRYGTALEHAMLQAPYLHPLAQQRSGEHRSPSIEKKAAAQKKMVEDAKLSSTDSIIDLPFCGSTFSIFERN